MSKNPKELLRSLFEAAVASAQPALCLPPFLPKKVEGKLIVIGAGKASAAMAKAVEDNYEGELKGLVVTRYGYNVPCEKIEIIEAAHPVPDTASVTAGRRILEYVKDLGKDDTVLCLISGGGSALMSLPPENMSLEDLQAINKELLSCGATINEMNCVRRNLSQISGGRLAKAIHPAKIINLLISDVPEDEPCNIASGPTVQDKTNLSDALAIIERYKISLPDSAKKYLDSKALREEAVDISGVDISTHLIATPQLALEAAASICRKEGYPTYILGDSIEGEAADVATVIAGISKQIANKSQPFSYPCVLLSGGETTVTLKGDGRGGRNVEFLLSFALAMNGQEGVYALAGDTDGVDGIEEIAGAICDPSTISRAWQKGINPRKSLENNDGHGFFEALGDSVITGPTRTNVNDFRAILINGDAS
ncbi:glycerate kinase type-2 family protein [Polycladidibacter stylochi]|uniref:glycerate kinase type-2 family protein n=1 Tax=Polycladidibacter stylochi TaxID=1807766 RepID=UPI0008370326|nr:glycerate kinase [Pseudovibrio stylochi]